MENVVIMGLPAYSTSSFINYSKFNHIHLFSVLFICLLLSTEEVNFWTTPTVKQNNFSKNCFIHVHWKIETAKINKYAVFFFPLPPGNWDVSWQHFFPPFYKCFSRLLFSLLGQSFLLGAGWGDGPKEKKGWKLRVCLDYWGLEAKIGEMGACNRIPWKMSSSFNKRWW